MSIILHAVERLGDSYIMGYKGPVICIPELEPEFLSFFRNQFGHWGLWVQCIPVLSTFGGANFKCLYLGEREL